eukprot:CAMPEP_0115008104 /NCGR_PEP_ID=MMETSP0216-20121206/21674_1 /TAXON_ID=223996 /ORGANISM="Protocruzia adherens, Strain Boccale" /LENGTH=1245 /DNA_ID=CAMNT_0002375369 /DNA_START=220 /DNA_END=3957 /DNA_ORIENTATION=-
MAEQETKEEVRGEDIVWDKGPITSSNINDFKELQKKCFRSPKDAVMDADVIPSFVSHVTKNLGTSQLFQDGQWTYTHHTYEVYGSVNSRCGYYIISASRDMHINIVHQYQMKLVKRWKAHTSTIMRCRLSKDDKYLFTCSFDQTAKVWELDKSNDYSNTPKEIQCLKGHSGWVYDVGLNPDEGTHELVTCSVDKSVKLWNWKEGTEIRTYDKGHADCIRRCIFSEDGTKIISAGQDARIVVWDKYNASIIYKLEGHTTYVLSLASKGSILVSGSTDKTIRVWDLEEGEQKRVLHFHSKNVESVEFVTGSNDKVISASLDKSIRIFDINTGLQEYVIEGHTGGVYDAQFSPDRRFVVSCSADKSVKLTKIEVDKMEQNRKGFHTGIIWGVSFSPDAKWYATSGSDQLIKIWEYYTYNVKQTLKGHTAHVTTVFFLPDNKHVVSTSYDNTTRIWEYAAEKEIAKMEDHGKVVWFSDCRHDQKYLATAGGSFNIIVYDISTLSAPTVAKTLKGHTYDVLTCKWHPDQDHIVISGSSDSTIRVWNINTESQLQSIAGHGSIIYHVVFLVGGLIATSSMDTTIRIWDWLHGRCEKVLRGHTHPIPALVCTPDRKRIISGSQDSTVKIWQAETGMLEFSFRAHIAWVRNLAVDPNTDRFLSVSDDGSVRVWKVSLINQKYYPFLGEDITAKTKQIEEIVEADPMNMTNSLYKTDYSIIHDLANAGNVKALRVCFQNSAGLPNGQIPLRRDISGRSPIHYALEKQNLNVVEFFLKNLHDYPDRILWIFKDIFVEILALDLPSMHKFIDSRLLKPVELEKTPGSVIPKFSTSIWNPKEMGGSSHLHLEKYGAIAPQKATENDRVVPIKVRCLYVPGIMTQGVMATLAETENPAIFKSHAIKSMLEFKWNNYARKAYVRELSTYILFLLLFTAFTAFQTYSDEDSGPFNDEDQAKVYKWVISIPLLLVLVIRFLGELKQFIHEEDKVEYYTDVWNLTDVLLIITSLTGIIMAAIDDFISDYDNKAVNGMLSIAVLLVWARLMSFLRGFREVGMMVRIIVEIIKDIKYFLLILGLGVCGFAHSYYLVHRSRDEDQTVTAELGDMYNLSLGDFNVDEFGTYEYLFFILGSFMMMILLLNMLIAIMSDTYARIYEEAQENAYMEWGKWIADIDKIMKPADHKKKNSKYIFLAEHVNISEEEKLGLENVYEAVDHHWKEMDDHLDKLYLSVDKGFDHLRDQIKAKGKPNPPQERERGD